MTKQQKKWCESRIGTYMRPNSHVRGGMVVDYKPSGDQYGAIFVIERANKSLVEEYRHFPTKVAGKVL